MGPTGARRPTGSMAITAFCNVLVPRSSLAPVQTIWMPRQNRINAVNSEEKHEAREQHPRLKVYPNRPIREADILELTAKARH